VSLLAGRPGLRWIGACHLISGIVHLAGSVPWPPGAHEPIDGARTAIDSLLNVIQAACDWDVQRVSVASTIGVYAGVDAESPLREDLPGRSTTNRELTRRDQNGGPRHQADLPDGRDPHGPAHDSYLDISRIHQDTGYRTAYDTQRAVADYIDWLRAGNPR
jgi:nucleoside-diphosphate-sugar epimerase